MRCQNERRSRGITAISSATVAASRTLFNTDRYRRKGARAVRTSKPRHGPRRSAGKRLVPTGFWRMPGHRKRGAGARTHHETRHQSFPNRRVWHQ